MSDMSDLSRRALLAAGMATAAAAVAPGAEDEEAWPHPHIGRDALPADWKVGDLIPGPPGAGRFIIFGLYVVGDRSLSRGRVYTEAEYDLIKADLAAYIQRRNPILEQRARSLGARA